MSLRSGVALGLVVLIALIGALAATGTALAAAPKTPQMKVQSHTATSAFLHGVLNPGVEPPQEGTYEFVYAVSATTCTGESKARRGLSLGFASEEVAEEIFGLASHTAYAVCLLHRNLAGEETLSPPETFTTSFEPEAPETGAVESISTAAATLTGALNPHGSRGEEPGFYEFLYKRSASECEGESATAQSIPAGNEKETVQAEVTGLAPGTKYTVCLRAWNATGQSATGSPVTFTTKAVAPALAGESASDVAAKSAHVTAQLASGGLPVTYTVQYGRTSAYGNETAPVAVGPETTTIGAQLSGLEPGVQYHYRFSATNNEGTVPGSDATFTTVALPQSVDGGCPNEQLRVEDNSTLLPDCRAYEMLTPAYKEGTGEILYPKYYSSDGESLTFESPADLAGTAGGTGAFFDPGVFLARRTAAGWGFAPLSPSAGEFAVRQVFTSQPDSGMLLLGQHTPAEPLDAASLYMGSLDSKFQLIGPLISPSVPVDPQPSNSTPALALNEGLIVPVAATSDFGHVILEASEATNSHWPFDHSQGDDLYEYAGLGNEEPTMVAVRGEKGSTNVEGFQCGVELGSVHGGTAKTFNALSADGETVFFTPIWIGGASCVPASSAPPVAEVWARVHGSVKSALPAETVDVSARSASECSGGCASSSPSNSNFEGASEDGEKVFFTSTQQLLNNATQDPEAGDSAVPIQQHGCGNTVGPGGCNLYEFEMGSRRLRLIAGGAEVLGVARIARDGSRVYFVAKGAIAGAGANVYGAQAHDGEPNLYAYDGRLGSTAFVATLGADDGEDWRPSWTRPVQLTGESGETGRFLLFVSSRPGVTPDDTGTSAQLFEYDAKTGELVRVSQGEGGYAQDGNAVGEGSLAVAEMSELENGEGGVNDYHHTAPRVSLSRDGQTVVFASRGRLSARASSAEQGCTSVYEYRSHDRISDGAVHLISDGLDTTLKNALRCGAQFWEIDAAGANVLFTTDDPLLTADSNGLEKDIYDARVDGGFPAPAPGGECVGEGCLDKPTSAPSLAGAASTGQAGEAPPVQTGSKAPKARRLSRAQKLARALHACSRLPRRRRPDCRARARRRYAPTTARARAVGSGPVAAKRGGGR